MVGLAVPNVKPVGFAEEIPAAAGVGAVTGFALPNCPKAGAPLKGFLQPSHTFSCLLVFLCLQ